MVLGQKTIKVHTWDGREEQMPENDIICLKMDAEASLLLYVMPSSNAAEFPGLEQTTIHSGSHLGNAAAKYSCSPLLASSSETAPSVHVIISTHSGANRAAKFHETLLRPLLDLLDISSASISTHTTTSATSISKLTRDTICPRASTGKRLLLILLSGDGGVTDLVDTLYAALPKPTPPAYINPIIALLPLGSGNAIAHSSNITADSTYGLSTLSRGRPRSLPTFIATLPPGTCALDSSGAKVAPSVSGIEPACATTIHGAAVFSWALHATLVAESDTPAYRTHGTARFSMAARELLFPSDGSESHAFRGSVQYMPRGGGDDDAQLWQTVSRDTHAYVLATLVARLEAAFCISPASRALDGVLRVVHFGPADGGGLAMMKVMEAAFDEGRHVDMEHVAYEEIEALRLRIDEEDEKWRRVCIDGRIFVVPMGGVVEVRREEESLVDLLVLDDALQD